MKIGRHTIDFKPEFGRTDHLRVLDMIGEAQKTFESLKENDTITLRGQLRKQVEDINRYIKFIHKK